MGATARVEDSCASSCSRCRRFGFVESQLLGPWSIPKTSDHSECAPEYSAIDFPQLPSSTVHVPVRLSWKWD